MNSIWDNARLKGLRQQFLTDFSAKITASCAIIPPAKQNKSRTKTHIVPPSMFSFLINQQGPQAPAQRPFKQAVITSTIKRTSSADKLKTKPVEASSNKGALLHLDTLDSLLNKDTIHPEVWNALTGEGADRVTDLEKIIRYVHPDALTMIQAHQKEFNDGVIFDNLPLGLQLKTTPDGALALCVEEPPRSAVTPLTVRLSTPTALSPDDQALNQELNTWFDDQLKISPNKDAALLSMLNLVPQQPVTDKIIALLSEFTLSEAQCKGLGHLLLRTGPQGVLICLQTLQRMKKDPVMFDEFNKIFLQFGDYYQFMSKTGQDNLDYFTQLRGSKLTWWNALVAQHQAAGARADFNDLFGAYRYFLTELESMGLNNLPSNCPFKFIKHMKIALDRALYIIKHVNPADRLFQLMALEGLDFGPNSAYFAMRYNDYQWVSKEMCFIPQDPSKITPLSYTLTADQYYQQVATNLEPSITDDNLLFYRYLGEHKPASAREMYDELKKQITLSPVPSSPAELAKVLYMVVMTTFGEEPNRDVDNFLKRLQAKRNVSTTELITALFSSFKDVSADKLKLNQLTQIITALDGLSYTPPETMLTLLPKLLLLSRTNDEVLTLIHKRHTALIEHENESSRFVSLINTLAGDTPWFVDNAPEKAQFIKILALLSDELTPHAVLTLETTLNALPPSNRSEILSLLSTVNLDKSTNVSSFTLASINQIVAAASAAASADDLQLLIATQLPGIKLGEMDEQPSTFTAVDCTKEFMTNFPLLKVLNSYSFLSGYTPQILSMIQESNNLSGDQFFKKLDADETNTQNILPYIKPFITMEAIRSTLEGVGESAFFPLVEEHFRTGSMRCYIDIIFLDRFKKAINLCVQRLQTGQPNLDTLLINSLNNVVPKKTDSYGTAAKLYDTQFQETQLFTNTLLQIKNRNSADFAKCVLMLNDTTLWASVGLKNMASLLQGLGDPVSEQLKSLLSTISSIETPPTDAQIQAAINDLTLLSRSKNELGDETYQMLLEQAIKHDLTQATSFPLAALIGFKQGSMEEIDKQKADELFQSVLRIIKISPPDEPEVLIALIDKTTRLIRAYAKDMPNIVPFLTLELNAIATVAEHREPLAAEPAPSIKEMDWWFLLTMLTTIMSAVHLLWVMVCAWLNPPAVAAPPEPDKKTAEALKDYNASLDTIETGLTRHKAALPEIAQLFTFFPFPSLKALTHFFTGEHHAETLTRLETEKDVALASLSEHNTKLTRFGPLMEAHVVTTAKDHSAQLTTNLKQTNKAYEDALKKSITHLKSSIKSFDEDPFKKPKTARALPHQRTIDRVEQVIHDMTHLLQNESFSDTEQHTLARQFMYLNVIGTDSAYPLVVGDQRCENLATTSRSELKGLSTALMTALRTRPNLTALEDETLTLQLLAVMREAYYRSTGIFPYSTQMLSVLVSLNHPGNLMLQINTGEGKSTTTALLAGLQCVRGGALDERKNKPRTQLVCTGNATLVEQGYAETHHFFNDFLGVPSSVINQVETDAINVNKLATGGITYTTVQALSFYKQREKREGKSFTHDDEGHALDIDTTLDECDSAFLDDYTQLSLVVPTADNELTTSNPHAWIYPMVIQFVMHDTAQDGSLRDFIENHLSTTTSQRLQLLSIPDSKLAQWLDAAYDVMDYKEGVDFVILEEEKRKINDIEKTMSIVTPINRSGAPQRGSSFPNYRHEMLQAKMKLKAPNKEFPIDPEVDVVDQESVKSLIDGLTEQGRIVGLSGTLGNTDELKELATTCHVHAIKIPPHQKNLRDTSTPVSVGDTRKKQDHDLQLEISKGKDQPLLVVCKTIRDVEKLYLKLIKKYPGRVQKITGKELASDLTQRKDRAGLNGMITIGTPLMGRGVDFKTRHPEGFHLHQRFIDAQRETEQVMGRVARNGQLGKYSASYVIEGVPFQYGFSYFGVDVKVAMQQLKEQQKQITQDAARVRYYIQAFDAVQQVTLQQFDACKQQLLETNPTAHESLERSLSTMRTVLIERLHATWNSNLPKGENSNPYLNNRNELNAALKHFEKHLIPDLWKETHAALLAMDSRQNGSRLTWLADIKPALNARKLIEKREKKQAAIHVQQAHQQLQSALDPAAATLYYSNNTLKEEEAERLKKTSDKKQLSYMVSDVNAIIGTPQIAFDENKTVAENLATIINAIDQSFNGLSIEKRYQLQPTFAQSVVYWRTHAEAGHDGMLSHPIEALEKQFKDHVHNAPAIELEKRLVWAQPNKKTMDYWFERPNIRAAADELYALAVTHRDSPKPTSLLNLYTRLYHYKLQFKEELTNHVSRGHDDIRVVIDDVLRHINELKRIESLDEASFQNARDEALYSVYFKRFNAQVEQFSTDYSSNQKWETIADNIKSLEKGHHNLSVLHDLKHYLSQHAGLELKPSNTYHYFFGPDTFFPVKALLEGLEADLCKIQQEVPEFSRDKRYLATKASALTDLVNENGMGPIKSLTITPKHSGIGEYFELRIEGAEHPELFDKEEDDVVRYTSNIAQLMGNKQNLEAALIEQNKKKDEAQTLLNQLVLLEPGNIQPIQSGLSEHAPAISTLYNAIQSWLKVKNKTYLSTVVSSMWSLIDLCPFSDEINQQIDDLLARMRETRDEATQQAEMISKDIDFLSRTIEEKGRVDEKSIIKQFQSIDELLDYEDKLSAHHHVPSAGKPI